MSRRDQVVTITSLGQHPGYDMQPRRRGIGLGGAIATGVAVLFAYLVFSAIFHILAWAAVWIPAVIVAGFVTRFLGRKGVPGTARLIVGIVVLVLVVSGLRSIGL